MKTFAVETLRAGDSKAGGTRARKNRFEVLDRLSHHGAGLSPSKRNDFEWWKHVWDDAMVGEHKANWSETFASWMQDVLNSSESNAFLTFMHKETNRVLRDSGALVVPGS